MKKVVIALPALLLLVSPVLVFARGDQEQSHVNLNISTSQVNSEHQSKSEKDEDNKSNEDEHENEDNDRELKVNHGLEESFEHQSTVAARIKLGLGNPAGHHISTTSATASATPSAHLNLDVRGPLDQVVKILENILNFLKGLL